jgi:hypothetical protein
MWHLGFCVPDHWATNFHLRRSRNAFSFKEPPRTKTAIFVGTIIVPNALGLLRIISYKELSGHVRFWHLADIAADSEHVRFWG